MYCAIVYDKIHKLFYGGKVLGLLYRIQLYEIHTEKCGTGRAIIRTISLFHYVHPTFFQIREPFVLITLIHTYVYMSVYG